MEVAEMTGKESASLNKNVNHSSRNKERFLLRLPLDVRNYLQAVSYKSCRSMNSEILVRLTHSLANFEAVSSEDLLPKENDESPAQVGNELDTNLAEHISKLSVEKKKHLLGLLIDA